MAVLNQTAGNVSILNHPFRVETGKTVTQPFYLVYLGTEIPMRYSSRGDVDFQNNTWAGSGVQVVRIQDGEGGSRSAQIRFPNHDKALSAVVLNEGVVNKVCRIYQMYGHAPFLDTESMLIFDGIMDEVPEIGEYVSITALSESIFNQYSPRLVCGPPIMNHIPPPGTQITWDGEIYILEKR